MLFTCYVCLLVDERPARPAVTLAGGTAVCADHLLNVANADIVVGGGA